MYRSYPHITLYMRFCLLLMVVCVCFLEFPAPPPLQHELKLAVDQAQDLESQVQHLLSHKEASEEEIEALINQVRD